MPTRKTTVPTKRKYSLSEAALAQRRAANASKQRRRATASADASTATVLTAQAPDADEQRRMAAKTAASLMAKARWSNPHADRDQPRRAGMLGGRKKIVSPCPKGCGFSGGVVELRRHKCHSTQKVNS